jgi:hypothetical protein
MLNGELIRRKGRFEVQTRRVAIGVGVGAGILGVFRSALVKWNNALKNSAFLSRNSREGKILRDARKVSVPIWRAKRLENIGFSCAKADSGGTRAGKFTTEDTERSYEEEVGGRGSRGK